MSKKSIEITENPKKSTKLEQITRRTRISSKNHLKTMLKSGKNHPLRTATRVTKYGTSGFARNLWLSVASIFVMSITLIVISGTLVANLILMSITDSMRDKIDITVYLKPSTTSEDLLHFSKLLYKNKNIRLVEVADSNRELEKFAEDRKDSPEIVNALKDPEMRELLLKSMNATMTIKLKNIDEIATVKQTIEQDSEIKLNLDPDKPPTYETKRLIIERIRSWANTARIGGLSLSAVFLTISILMIINTVKIAIFSRKEEIYMMKLVGASPNFTKGPFLVEAEISGIISGIIASMASILALNFILPRLAGAEIDTIVLGKNLSNEHIVILSIAIIALGALIGAISARLAIRKYIR